MSNLAGAAVALIVLIDLATGQGPPIFTSYMRGQPAGYGPAGEQVAMPIGYASYVPTEAAEVRAAEEEKGERKSEEKSAFASEKKEETGSTPAPGVLSSFTGTMSDAWSEYGASRASIESISRDGH